MLQIGIAKTERGYEISYDGCLCPESESPSFGTHKEAEQYAIRVAAEIRAWDRAGLADAPHIDSY